MPSSPASPTSARPPGRTSRALAALTTGLALVAAGLAAAPAAATPSAPSTASASAGLPDVVPSIDGWEPAGGGVFTATGGMRIVHDAGSAETEAVAGLVADELGVAYPGTTAAAGDAGPGDVRLVLDDARTDLGAEGYELTVGDAVTVTAATRTGVFYGTRTLTQMLTQQAAVPQGSVVDVPEYAERGVTLCACVINVSPDWIDRLIEEMSYLKLNTLMVELKVKVDGYPETNTWSYYTKDDVRELVQKASRHGIDVVPEINSPGHMEIWLENLPELQLTNEQTGEKDEVRMDITQDASFDFYTDLVDEYSEVFTSEYWHMGVDEYMLGSGYKNYPQILRFAQEHLGADATEDDVVAWYVNKVNDYVRSQGKTLRIWNDGVMTDNQVVPFDTDIVVEHWNQAGSTIEPQQFVDWGHDVVNVSNSLYMVRGGYGVDSAGLYDSGWTPAQFHGSTVTEGAEQVRGARMSMWPDAGTPAEAENTTEERMFEPLRLVAQATWSDSRPWPSYAEFRAAMDAVGRPPLWENVTRLPVDDGSYTIAAADGSGALAATGDGTVELAETGQPLTLTHTEDDYYVVTSSDGRCLDVARDGTMRLDVPVEIGADVRLRDCADTTVQKWQVKQSDGAGAFTVVNAATQQHLSVSEGLVDVPVSHSEPKTVEDGRVVQTPADWGATEWELTGAVSMGATLSSAQAAPGESVTATVSVTNDTDAPLAAASVRAAGVPEGWTALPREAAVEGVEPGGSASVEVRLFNVAATSGAATFSFELVGADGTVVATASTSANALCATGTLRPAAVADVSSEQTSGESAPSGPAAAAIDGDAATYWHSRWSDPVATYPHAIVVDLGETTSTCGLWYTARQSGGSGGANGRVGEYEVYTSTDVTTIDGDWGEPATTGEFASSAEPQLAGFGARQARYVKLVALSEVGGNPWATVAELAAAGPAVDAPTYDPTIALDEKVAARGAHATVRGAGFAPGETVSFEAGRPTAGLAVGEAVADADGAVTATVAVPRDVRPGPLRVTGEGATSGATAAARLVVTGAAG
ncbi:family 20 glycosylhydrolase [Isoptericola cucumis]|uniref:family 20 glycosylhydrolase n=1 Tax=Isoptericola cucumis TaxID=1776856 RepID=UPI0032089173